MIVTYNFSESLFINIILLINSSYFYLIKWTA